MDSIGRQTAIYPLLPLVGSILPAEVNITPVGGIKYHTVQPFDINSTGLYDRGIAQVPVAWRYSPYSPVVGALLQQRAVLQQQLSSVQGMSAYKAFVNQAPHLQPWLNEGVLPGSLPFNFLFQAHGDVIPMPLPNMQGTVASAFSQPLSTYIASQASVLQTAAQALQPYSPILQLYGNILSQRLRDNQQKMLFQGYAVPGGTALPPRVYPLDDLVNYSYWLGAPSDYPLLPMRGFSVNHPAFWPNEQHGFLINREPALQGANVNAQENRLYQHPLWPSLNKYLRPFGYPATHQKDRGLPSPADRVTGKPEAGFQPKDWESVDDDSIIGADERLAATVTPKVHPIKVDPPVKAQIKPEEPKAVVGDWQQQKEKLEKEKSELLEQKDKAVQEITFRREQALELENKLQTLEQQFRQKGVEKQEEAQRLRDEIAELKQLESKGDTELNQVQQELIEKLAKKEQELLSQQASYDNERKVSQEKIQTLKSQLSKAEKTVDCLQQARANFAQKYKSIVAKKENAVQAEQELNREQMSALEPKISDLQQRYNELEAERNKEVGGLKGRVKFPSKVTGSEADAGKAELINRASELEEQLGYAKEKEQLNKSANRSKSDQDRNAKEVSKLKKQINSKQDECQTQLDSNTYSFSVFRKSQEISIREARDRYDTQIFRWEKKCNHLEGRRKEDSRKLIEKSKEIFKSCIDECRTTIRDKETDFQEKESYLSSLAERARNSETPESLGEVLENMENLKKGLLNYKAKVEFDSTPAFRILEDVQKYAATHAVQQPKNDTVPKSQEGGPLQEAINVLGQPGNKHEQLQALFDSSLGAKLAGRNNEDISSDEMDDSRFWRRRTDAGKNKDKLDTQSIKSFIRQYKEAIRLEIKPNREKTYGAHQERKQCRLDAIDKIDRFISAQDERGADYEQHCQLACQALMRVREPSFVYQRNTPRCGGIAVIQHAWREKPDKAVEILLSLYLKKKAVVNSIDNKSIEVAVAAPDRIQQSKEAMADSFLVCSFYKSDAAGSIMLEDAYVAGFFGFKPLLYDRNSESGYSSGRDDLPEVLHSVSKNGGTISLAIKSELIDKLQNDMVGEINEGWQRKSDEKKRTFLGFTGKEDKTYSNHAITIEDFQFNDQNVYIKLYSWGKVKRYTINKRDFLSQVDRDGVLIYPRGNYSNFHGVKNPQLETVKIDNNGNRWYLNCNGIRKKIFPDVLYKGDVTGGAFCSNGNKTVWWFPSKNEEFVFAHDGKDFIPWSNDKGGLEQLSSTKMGNKWVVAKKNGEFKVLEKNQYVKGFGNKEYIMESDHGSHSLIYRSRDCDL